MRRRTAVVAVAVGLALLGGIGGCSSDDEGGESSSADSGGMSATSLAEGGGGGDAAAEGADEAGGAAEPAGADLGAQAPPEEAAERIIYTADVRVRVEDPTAAAADAVEMVEGAGGSLASQTERDGEDVVTVTVRVPVDGFRSALDALAELGEVLDRHIVAEDVTDQVVDLEGRLENARASADRLRQLYATAEGVEQIVAIEEALTQREAEVESLAGQLQQLEDRADRSTITVTFVDEGEPVASDDEDDRTGFVGGLRTGWDVIVAVASAVATVAGFLVPFLPVVLVAGLAALVAQRLRHRRRGRGPAGPVPPPAPPPVATSAPETPSPPS